MYKFVLVLAVVAVAMPANAQRGGSNIKGRSQRSTTGTVGDGVNLQRSASMGVTITDVNTGETRETTIDALVDTNKCTQAGRTIPQTIFKAYTNDSTGTWGGIATRLAKPGDKIPLNEIIDRAALEQQVKIMGEGLYIHIGPQFGNDWAQSDLNKDIFFSKSTIINGCHIGFIKGKNGSCNDNGDTAQITPDNLDEYYIYINPSARELLGHSGLLVSRGSVGIGFIGGPGLGMTSGLTSCYGRNIVYNQRTYSIDLGDVFAEAGSLWDSMNNGNAEGEDRPNIKEACGKLDKGAMEKVKNMLLASTIVSGVGAAGGVTSAIATGVSEKEGVDSKGAKTVGMIGSIASAATGTASAVMTGISIGDVEKAIKQIDECKKAVSKL